MKLKSSKGFQIDGTKKFKKVPQLRNQKDFTVDGTKKFRKAPK